VIDPYTKRKAIGLTIAFSSLAAMFCVGWFFDLFESDINFAAKPAHYLFFGFIGTAVFGVLYILMRTSVALRVTLAICGIYTLLYIAGKFSRGEF
jgi:hypothetical protein